MKHKRNLSKISCLLFLFLFIAIGFSLYCGSNEEAVKKENIHTVKISVTDEGKFSYEPLIVKMDRGDTIEWIFLNKGYYFAVHIGWNTPLDIMKHQGNSEKPIRGQVREDAPNGRYKYFVAAFDLEKEILLTDDPDFIVKPPPGR